MSYLYHACTVHCQSVACADHNSHLWLSTACIVTEQSDHLLKYSTYLHTGYCFSGCSVMTRMLQSAMTAVQATHQEAQERCNSAKSKVEQATHELHNLQRNSGPHQDAMTFDGQAGFLLDAIHKNKHRFRKPVLGPIGTCLSLEPSADRYAYLPNHSMSTSSCCRQVAAVSIFHNIHLRNSTLSGAFKQFSVTVLGMHRVVCTLLTVENALLPIC